MFFWFVFSHVLQHKSSLGWKTPLRYSPCTIYSLSQDLQLEGQQETAPDNMVCTDYQLYLIGETAKRKALCFL